MEIDQPLQGGVAASSELTDMEVTYYNIAENWNWTGREA